ncbi:hypothetical protein DPH57_07405 [Massilia sp. YMA4]|nr:hypothetical protein DPH57_07405 [Massilia sp. YMA4]
MRGGGAVLVLRQDGGHVACVVERVRSMARSGQAGARFIAVAGEGGTESYRIVDLVAMLDRLGSVPNGD